MLGYIWPIALVVVANVFYNITTKSTPSQANAFLSLAVTYCVAAACAFGLYLFQGGHQKLPAELSKLNWTAVLLGISVVALEFGYMEGKHRLPCGQYFPCLHPSLGGLFPLSGEHLPQTGHRHGSLRCRPVSHHPIMQAPVDS